MSAPARIALLTPFAPPSVRGNAITAARIARGLGDHGIDPRVWDLSLTPVATIEADLEAYRPSVIHALHAYRVGPLALRLARRAEVPLVVTLTGTDANHDLFDPERAAVVRRVLEGAAVVTAFHPSIGDLVSRTLPDVSPRVVIVPQSVRLDAGPPLNLDARWPLPPERVLFVLPAGIREVKRPRFPLAPLERVHARHPALRLLYVGPGLDPDEEAALCAELAGRPWARLLGAVPHASMRALLTQADVVLNCSLSEGGMANSVLEAFAMERAVLASDIEGNRSLVKHGVTGLLFADEAGLETAAETLLRDPALRWRLGVAGRALVEERFPASREVEGYRDVYASAAVGRIGRT